MSSGTTSTVRPTSSTSAAAPGISHWHSPHEAIAWTSSSGQRYRKTSSASGSEKHGIQDRIRVLDQWAPLAATAYDAVCAIDVLEHLESLEEILANLLQSIRPGGVLAELSPFVRNASNPMHHEVEATFFRVMQMKGFSCTEQLDQFRLWRAAD
jgi:cyclopropane fatty-acyl-phospholipid synthase-like methyltransferase